MANLLLECILCLLLMLYETLSLNRSLWQNGQISVLTVEEVTEVFFFFFFRITSCQISLYTVLNKPCFTDHILWPYINLGTSESCKLYL